MRNKICLIIACILVISYTVPVLGFTELSDKTLILDQDPNQNWRLKVKHLNDGRLPPAPGEMSEKILIEPSENIKKINNPPKTIQSIDETILDIIQNVEDTLILGYLENLTAFGPRLTGTPACQQAGEYIYDEFESYGLEARYDDWSYSGYSGNNIEGTLKGINETSDEIYIICAHYDTVSSSPGADDDGSGTAAVLAAAYIMSQYEFNYTIRFLAVDGEEQGLLGSHEYAEEASNNGDNIVAVLNGDMIGYAANPTQASFIKIYENTPSEWITDFTEEVSQTYYDFINLTVVPSGTAYNSDHASFWSFGYDAIMYHEYQFNPYYHSSQDIIENMDVNYSTRVSKLMIATLGELAEAQIINIPPDKPIITGPSTGYEGEEITIYFSTTDPEEHDLYYFVDWGDGTYSEWLGPYVSGETAEAYHVFEIPAEYNLKVKAKDIKNGQSEWSDLHPLTILEDTPPNKPTITGPRMTRAGKEVEFKFTAVDPEGHDVYYYINWGDDIREFWLGPYASGETVTFSHIYNESGSFKIISKAKDICDKEGQQNQFTLLVLKNKALTHSLFIRLLEKLMDHFPILEQLLIR